MPESPQWKQIKGKWNQFQGAAREKWGRLTDDEIAEAKGEREQLIGLVQEKYGIAREEAREQVDEFANDIKQGV